MLGKRKRITREELEQSSRSVSPSSASPASVSASDSEDVQALFRRAFEAKFGPLAIEPVISSEDIEHDDDETEELEEEESTWSGITSESEDQNVVEEVDYTNIPQHDEETSRAELKSFMSSKPPPLSTQSSAKQRSAPKPSEEDTIEASHLKNDLALQSLLREASLLSRAAPTFSSLNSLKTSTTAPSGTMRHKLIDMHLQELGAKRSVFTQANMPMKDRKGIMAKRAKREEDRRREAKENGIVLERPDAGKKGGSKTRDANRLRGGQRGEFGAASVGKFKNGALTLSRKDVFSITRAGGGGRGGRSTRGRGSKRGVRR